MPAAEDVAQVIASNRFAKPREIEEAREWGERYHPDKDLAELLFMRGVLDRAKVSLIRKMAKMSRGSTGRAPRAPSAEPPEETDAGEETRDEAAPDRVRVRDLRNEPPERVGKYEVLEKVAQGGMGIIFKARHVDLDRMFALKILTARTRTSEEAKARFEREAKTAARLDHPNIVRVHDAGVEEGAPYLVMDYVDGANLGEVIQKEGFGVRKAAQVARSIALALQHAHENGVVHRDVKPDNIILDAATGEPKITDFGIVKEVGGDDDEQSKLTQTGYTLGSPCYMSPEQAAGRHEEVGPRSDVYSLAATLYEMLTERPPHDGESIHEIMTKVVREDPLPVRSKNPAVPRDLDVVCMKALEKELDRRYTTAQELAEDLGRFLDEEPVLAKPAGLGTKVWRTVRRNRATSVLLVAFVLVTLAGLGSAWSWQRGLREEARAQRERRLARAVERLTAASAAKDPRAKRSAYYDSLQELELVLRDVPGDERARAAKRQVVLALGDHLIESGEASFAEFVFALGAGVADAAEIASRIETARLGIYAEKAEQAELAGDLELALEHYQKGLRTLQEAGFGGERIQARIDDLTDLLRERRSRQDADELMRLAEASAASGDHVAAYLTYGRALELVPDDREVAARLEHHRQKADEAFLRLREEAHAVRGRAEAVRESVSSKASELGQPLNELIDAGNVAVASADEARQSEGFAVALAKLSQARGHFETALGLVSAVRGRELAQQEARQAEARQAVRFAPKEMGQGRDFAFRGDQALEQGDYARASERYALAAATYRRAARTGSSKSVVADARDGAQRLRKQLVTLLAPRQRTPRFDAAEADFQRAERHYDQKEHERARDLYQRASGGFEAVLKQAPQIREAFAAQSQARELRETATAALAREFASDDFSRARQSELTGDQAMAKNEASVAIKAYGDAIYRYKRSTTKALPHAAAKREYEALLVVVGEARQICVDDELEWKPNFKRAEERLRQAQEALERRYWNGAKRHLERALKLYRSLHR